MTGVPIGRRSGPLGRPKRATGPRIGPLSGRGGLMAYHTGRRRPTPVLSETRRPTPTETLHDAPRPPADDQRPAETTTATGDQWVIGHGHQRAVITEVGATLRSFTVEDRPVLDGFGPSEWSHGGRGQVLAPWPNRLGDGRYSFEGVESQAPINEPERGNAIHGLVRWMPWRMVGRAQNRVSMACELRPSPAYPFALRLTIEYRLGRDGLVVATEAENFGRRRPSLRPRLPPLSDGGDPARSTRCA